MTSPGATSPRPAARTARAHAAFVLAVGLVARLAIVAWGASRFPPSADGTYYHALAARIAEGHGYTWLWPDGAVTYAAHYPVGYPALLALGYAVFGPLPVVAMVLNAIVGAAAGVAAWSLVARSSGPRLALAAGLAVALHPALVPYTAALMTEGVTAALLLVATALAADARAARRPWRGLVAVGLVLGAATLVRPQSIVLAPALGWLGVAPGARWAARARAAAIVTALALAVCAPWTARNCARMDRCALVSVNGGWNLAIGAQTDTGGWQELAVPPECRAVFAEAAKDACFGRAARASIANDPAGWLARVPAKLRVTFDYFGAAPWYLHAANASAFSDRAKVALGAVETLASRLLLAAALVAALRAQAGEGRVRRALRRALVAVGLVACVLVPGALAYLALAAAILASGRAALERAPVLVPATAAMVIATAATHAAFFGAGRYGLVVVPFVTALAFTRPKAVLASAAEEPPCREA